MNQFTQNLRFLFLFGLALTFFACGGVGKKKPVYPAEVDASMKAAFAVAEGSYNRRNLSTALSEYQKFISAFAYNALTDESYYKMGKIYFLQGQWGPAIGQFETLMKKSPDPAYRSKGGLMAGYSAYRYQDYRRALQYLNQADPQAMTAKLNLRLYSTRVLVGEKLGLSRQEIDYSILRMADIYEDGTDPGISDLSAEDLLPKRDVMRRLHGFVTAPLPDGRIPAWFRSYPKTFSKPYVEYKWGKTLFEAGDTRGARRKLSEFVDAWPKHEYADSARVMLKELGGAVPVAELKDVLKIGVLLPLSGPQGAYGRTVLRGIECASGMTDGCTASLGTDISRLKVLLVTRDSGTMPDEVTDMMDELENERVSAIIGPMSGELAEAASKRAEQINIPLFPITQKPGIEETGGYVFPMGYPAAQQIRDLVNRAMARGQRNFAVLYPNSSYGQEMSGLFVSEVGSQGGKIAAKAAYNPSKPDLAGDVRRLKLGQSRFSYTGTTAGFDALFIPDSYRVINHLIPYLKLSGITGIALLGTNAWNDAALSPALSADYPGSFFLDIFYPGNRAGKAPAFVNGFRSALNFRRGDIRDALLVMDALGGATGIQSFGESGASVTPFALTAGEGGIRQTGN
ncbi:MAG: penicillin-binding protein activator [Deltaproteobacteria bacterium]|nr:penicillin-binding protein activator [Deltaproteobacteria bacterium]